MAKEPELNSVDRFRKQPGRLVLEEYSHCEVPAGCGGVVLRWRNPLQAVPVTIYLYTPVKPTCLLDGVPLETGRVDLAPGPHVLAVTFESADAASGRILFAAAHDPAKRQASPGGEVEEAAFTIVTADNGTWKYAPGVAADDAWTRADFDDAHWPSLTACPTPNLGWGDYGAHACRAGAKLGAAFLRLPDGEASGVVRIRKVFSIPSPRLRNPTS
jgi:hypothetical protein